MNNIGLIKQNFKTQNVFSTKLKILFFVEMWERFSYYGMRALLVLFLTSHLGFKDANAYAIYSLFAAIGYAGPVLGGFLADKIMGFRNMVLIGGIIITIGHVFMTLIELKQNFIFLGLSLIALGTGLFKGNITNLLGACYTNEDPNRETAFTLFYVGINLGSFLASILCGYIAKVYGWEYGFGLAGLGMLIGLLTFLRFQNVLENKGDSPNPELMKRKIFLGLRPFELIILSTLCFSFLVSEMLKLAIFFANILTIIGLGVFGIFGYIILKSPKNERENLIALSIMIFFLMCFFALEMQLGSFINLFTERNVVNTVFGFMIPASVSQAINPLSIIIFGSLLSTLIKFNKKYSVLMLSLGLLSLVLCFFILYIGCINANAEHKVSFKYLLFAISAMSLGEVCMAPLIQSQATLLAPQKLRGFVMGILMFALTFSNLLGIVLSKLISVPSIKGVINVAESLIIYKKGFFNIALFNCIIVLLFIICAFFLHKVLSKNSLTE